MFLFVRKIREKKLKKKKKKKKDISLLVRIHPWLY